MSLERKHILPEPELPCAADLLAEGRALARTWTVGPSAFLDHVSQPSEAAFKRACAARGRIMQHAQVGFRDLEKSKRAYAEIHEACAAQGVTVDRYGICLDWAMGYPSGERAGRAAGTGLILEGPEEFAALSAMAPVAPHFGDFVLGFPSALENTRAALAAGSTAIGNIGQYFTFRLPGRDDDVELTAATVTALGLIAGQDREVLVHSNLDDGFAALFTDTACALGAVLIEKHIVEKLAGASVSHCYGHHFSDPVKRIAFHLALCEVSDTPGTMVYGNTMSYRSTAAANHASLASYLMADILAQRAAPSGHAVNPVPVTENVRIPDIDEIIDAQCFAARLIEHADGYGPLATLEEPREIAAVLVREGRRFARGVMKGLEAAGINTGDAVELLLAIRRIGARRLEALYGPGRPDEAAPRGRAPVVPSPTVDEIEAMAAERLGRIGAGAQETIAAAGLKAMVATTDVHEHGKLLVERVLGELGLTLLDGGVSTDPEALAEAALAASADLIALSTYNGVALAFMETLKASLERRGAPDLPVIVGGRLNQVPESSNTSLPVDVSDELVRAGAIVCREIEEAAPALVALAEGRNSREERTG